MEARWVYGQVLWHVAADASGATEQLRKAIELDPLASLNWSRLGQVQVHLDEREPARMALRRAFDLDGKNDTYDCTTLTPIVCIEQWGASNDGWTSRGSPDPSSDPSRHVCSRAGGTMADFDMLLSTIEPGRRRDPDAGPRAPALTILHHPDVSRVGEAAHLLPLLEGRGEAVSRLSPAFGQPGSPQARSIADRQISRSPIRIEPAGEGVRLWSESTSPVELDGTQLAAEPRVLSRADLDRGVVLLLADRVALLLHRLGPPAPPLADLGMVGRSAGLEGVRADILRVADLNVPVLLLGESGTGKELAARALAAAGQRARGPFLSVNLASVPAALAASELFGHAAGAFTGAQGAHVGYFARASGGTLFLDEVGAAPPDLQATLLRALESGEVQPLGTARPQQTDARVVAATDEDLEESVRGGRFRQALLHRLAGYVVVLPPLRERRDDVGRLFRHFLVEELASMGESRLLEALAAREPWLPASVVAHLARLDWPGNVRQLRNVVRHLAVRGRGGHRVDLESLPRFLLQGRAPSPAPPEAGARPAPASIAEEALVESLRRNGWRTAATARELGISRTTLYALIEKSDRIRKARDVEPEEIVRCHAECGGDFETMAARLEVSARGLKLRMRELGAV